jgi:hypothetical protein
MGQLKEGDKNAYFLMLLENVSQDSNSTVRFLAFTQIKVLLDQTIDTFESFLAPEFIAHCQALLFQLLTASHLTAMERKFLFLVINLFIRDYVKTGRWPKIIVATPEAHCTLRSFASYLGTLTADDEAPPDLMQQIMSLVNFQVDDPCARCAVLALPYSVIPHQPEMIKELFGAIPDVLLALPDANGLVDTALTEFSNLYRLHGLHRPIVLPHLAGFAHALLLLAGTAECDYGTRIPAFETLDELIAGEAKPTIGGFLMADFETFIGTIVPVLSEPSDGADVGQTGLIYSCALQVLEDVVETSEARQQILSSSAITAIFSMCSPSRRSSASSRARNFFPHT